MIHHWRVQVRQLWREPSCEPLGHLATGVGFRGHHCHQVALLLLPCPPPPVPRSPTHPSPPATSASLEHSLSGMPLSLLFNFPGKAVSNHHQWVNYNRNLLILEARV